jgi:glutamine cyclotransferase
VPGTNGQISLTLLPIIDSYTVTAYNLNKSSIINFFPYGNTAQISYYPFSSSYQPSIAFFNEYSMPESLNIHYYFPNGGSMVSSINLRSIQFDMPNALLFQEGYFSALVNSNNYPSPLLFNRDSMTQYYYPSNLITFPSGSTGNFQYNALLSPFKPFVNGSRSINFYRPINANPTNWIIPEILVPTTSIPLYYTYKIVNTYPHDRTAFTQGLVYENGFLYEGTGISGRSTLRKVDLETGDVLQSVDLSSQYFGEGITILGDRIIQLTWLHNVGFVYDKSNFELLGEFHYPTEGWGITHNGKSLIMSDGTSTLHFLDPLTFAETSIVEVYDKYGPVSSLNELEYIQGEIYANVFKTNRIVRISPTTGKVLGWIDLKGLLNPEDIISPVDVLNGIAYDSKLDRLFVTGKLWPKLFEIDLINL